MSISEGFLAAARWGEDHRDEAVDLARLLGALVVVEVLASLSYAVGFVAWAWAVTENSPTAIDLLGGTAWLAGVTLSEIMLVEAYGWGNLDAAVGVVASYAVAVAVLALAVRRWGR